MKNEVKSCIEKIETVFPRAFINTKNELILEPRINAYFLLSNVKTEMDFTCKLIAYLSRPACKGVSAYWQRVIRKSLNELLGTKFTLEQMELIYTYLGNDVNRALCIQFVNSGYNLKVLEDYAKSREARSS